MTKCDLCKESKNVNGVCVCPWSTCVLTNKEWEKILDAITKSGKKE